MNKTDLFERKTRAEDRARARRDTGAPARRASRRSVDPRAGGAGRTGGDRGTGGDLPADGLPADRVPRAGLPARRRQPCPLDRSPCTSSLLGSARSPSRSRRVGYTTSFNLRSERDGHGVDGNALGNDSQHHHAGRHTRHPLETHPSTLNSSRPTSSDSYLAKA